MPSRSRCSPATRGWRRPIRPRPLAWGVGGYWETTTARRHPRWRDVDLPRPTKDLARLRHDFRTWGYGLIEEGLSDAQYRRMRARLYEQAAGERLAGIEQQSPYGQYVNTLVNKGACFAACIEHDPSAVQAGPVIEQLVDETLGRGWICHAFLANGADPGKLPQGLHIDQGALIPWITFEAPVLVNTMYMLDDVDERNGGTLIIPGSHLALIEAARTGRPVGALPPPINLDARGGTIMVFDGRLLHGTGANRTEQPPLRRHDEPDQALDAPAGELGAVGAARGAPPRQPQAASPHGLPGGLQWRHGRRAGHQLRARRHRRPVG